MEPPAFSSFALFQPLPPEQPRLQVQVSESDGFSDEEQPPADFAGFALFQPLPPEQPRLQEQVSESDEPSDEGRPTAAAASDGDTQVVPEQYAREWYPSGMDSSMGDEEGNQVVPARSPSIEPDRYV